MDLNWSLQPLYFLLLFVGVDLNPDGKVYSKSRKFLTFSYCLICLFLNLAIHISALIYVCINLEQHKLETITSSWNLVIDYLNFAIHGLASHLILLIVVKPRWASVLESFRCLNNQLELELIVRLRRLSLLGVFSAVLWV